jgi:hypothetical protein
LLLSRCLAAKGRGIVALRGGPLKSVTSLKTIAPLPRQSSKGAICNIRFIFAYTWRVDNFSATHHRVLMNFMVRPGGWHISFLEKDCQTVLPLKLTFANEDKIRAMHDRCGSQLLEDKQALEHGLNTGRGSCWLSLTEQQYQALNSKRR